MHIIHYVIFILDNMRQAIFKTKMTNKELHEYWKNWADAFRPENTWDSVKKDADRVDELINAFNEETGLLKKL